MATQRSETQNLVEELIAAGLSKQFARSVVNNRDPLWIGSAAYYGGEKDRLVKEMSQHAAK